MGNETKQLKTSMSVTNEPLGMRVLQQFHHALENGLSLTSIFMLEISYLNPRYM